MGVERALFGHFLDPTVPIILLINAPNYLVWGGGL